MGYDISHLIDNEDKRNPYTDEKIAEICSLSREEVTIRRQQQGIADSRERRRSILIPEIKDILREMGEISDRKLTQMLNERGYDISRFVAHAIKSELMNNSEIEKCPQKIDIEPDIYFRHLIGYDGSMKLQISQAQAAVLYPPRGLHTLIHGPSGVGKSQLAESMHNFAVESGALKSDSPFIIFNCADYADNSELLMSQLFGYVNGAFTGAVGEKAGLVEKANGGILFLDEVHRLPSEGQEMLFYLIDHGLYRKLGDSESTRKAQLLIIAATTEDLNSYLLTTFRRRIPMVIDLPPLCERPISERYFIMKSFFHEEALRLDRRIVIEKEALKLLLSYSCPGNIGQLRSDIQVSCAKSFLKCITAKEEKLLVCKEDIPAHAFEYIENKGLNSIKKYFESDLIISNIQNKEKQSNDEPNVYQFVEDRYEELKENLHDEKEIYNLLGKELDHEMENYFENMKYKNYDMKRLEEIVGNRIIKVVHSSLKIIEKDVPGISANIIYPLCLHISASYERLKIGKIIINPQLNKIKSGYPKEFLAAKKIAEELQSELNVNLLEDEIAFIAMYIKTFSNDEKQNQGRIGIIVLTHGNVGMEMVKVANELLNTNYAIGMKCDLDEAPSDALEKVQRAVEYLNQDKGCLLLTDMGSLVTFGQIITQRTGIDVRTISRVDTVMVIEAIRRALLDETTLEELENALNAEKEINFHGNIELKEKENVIVSICLTGKGSAVLIQSEIQKILNASKLSIRIITLGIINEKGVAFELDQLQRNYNILAIVGNFKVEYRDVPFLSTSQFMNKETQKYLISLIEEKIVSKNNPVIDLLDKNLISCCNKDVLNKNDILEMLVKMLFDGGYVSEEYLLDVYKREAMGGTIMKYVAIPHGFTEHVTKPAIALLTLNEPIMWEEDFKTNIIMMPALQEENINYTNGVFQICSNKELIQALSDCDNPEDIIYEINKHTKPST